MHRQRRLGPQVDLAGRLLEKCSEFQPPRDSKVDQSPIQTLMQNHQNTDRLFTRLICNLRLVQR